MLVTRIAPTPSGFLHPGNAVNFLLTDWLVRQQRGRLLLRIDDLDAGRVRGPYLDDVFRVLEWLGIRIDAGPSNVDEFRREYSTQLRTDYFRAQARLVTGCYACSCSRRDLVGGVSHRCPEAGLPWEPARTALRVAVPRPCPVRVGSQVVDVAAALGDFVVWRRDDLPAFQLASVVEDRDLGVNAVVRGLDLIDSTAAQLFLAPMLGAAEFARADFRHHALIHDDAGQKLAKSAGRQGVSMAGDDALLRRVRALARGLAATVGIEPQD